jgi:hypothetical protein
MKRDPHGELIPEDALDEIGLYPGGVSAGIRTYTTQWGLPCWECPSCGAMCSIESGGAASHKCPWQTVDKEALKFFRRGIASLFDESLNP